MEDEFRVQGSGIRVQGVVGFGVQDSGLRTVGCFRFNGQTDRETHRQTD